VGIWQEESASSCQHIIPMQIGGKLVEQRSPRLAAQIGGCKLNGAHQDGHGRGYVVAWVAALLG